MATSLNNIGDAYQDLGKAAEALTYLPKSSSHLGKDLWQGASPCGHQSKQYRVAYQALGKAAEALTYSQRALAIWEKIYGKEHPDVAISLNNIGMLIKT